MVSSAIMSAKLSMPYSSCAVSFSFSRICSLSAFGSQTMRAGPPSAFRNFFEEMKCLPWPMKPGVCTPPPVMDAISEKLMPSGVMPTCSRLTMTTPLDSGSMPQMHSKQPQEVIGSSRIE